MFGGWLSTLALGFLCMMSFLRNRPGFVNPVLSTFSLVTVGTIVLVHKWDQWPGGWGGQVDEVPCIGGIQLAVGVFLIPALRSGHT